MPYNSPRIAPGLDGFLAQKRNSQIDSQMEMQGLMGLLRLKQAQAEAAQRAQTQPLEMELLRAKIAEAKSAPERAALEMQIKKADLASKLQSQQQGAQQQAALTGLSGLLARPYQAPGAPPPDAVAMSDQEAIQQLMAAGGKPMRVDVPNPAIGRALALQADPKGGLLSKLYPQPSKATAPSSIGKLIAERDALPPGDPRRAFYDQAIQKQSTHSPAVNVYSGSLTPGVDAQGKPVFVQPSGRPDTPPRVVENVFPPPKPATQRAVPTPLANKLTEAAELADATTRFSTTFQDRFGGKTFSGDLSNVTGRLLGDESGQAQWWQDYELHQSQIRNKLFGSALTASEIEAWNKSAINPRMNSGEIRKNLNRRKDLEAKGLERLMKGAAAGGYNKEQIEALTGRTLDGAVKPTAPLGEKKRLRFDAQGNLVQ